MKIAQIVCVYPPYRGGIGNVAYHYHELLSARGHRVETFTPQYRKIGNNSKIKYLKPFIKYGNAAFIPQLFFLLKEFDIIHLHYPFYGGQEVIWLKNIFSRKKAPLIIQYHMDVDYNSLLTQILSLPTKIISSSLFNMSDKIICSTVDYIKKSQMAKYYRKQPNKFIEIPFGVDSNKFTPREKKDASVPNILFVGGLDDAHYFKGLEVLFHALRKLKSNVWRLGIVGSGNLQGKFQTMANVLNIGDNIVFLGNLDNDKLADAYRQADIFILPSINSNEAFGLVLLEAMASGVSVIASRLPGVRKVFKNQEEGLQSIPGDADDLAMKINQLILNPELRIRMGRKGRKLVLEKYHWEKVAQKLEEVYKKLLANYENSRIK